MGILSQMTILRFIVAIIFAIFAIVLFIVGIICIISPKWITKKIIIPLFATKRLKKAAKNGSIEIGWMSRLIIYGVGVMSLALSFRIMLMLVRFYG